MPLLVALLSISVLGGCNNKVSEDVAEEEAADTGEADTDTEPGPDSGVANDTGYFSDNDADADGFSEREGDCDDFDDMIYPGAEDTWYDGVDSDCDGWSDYDADRDGYDSTEYDGDDCDDTDPEISPAATEIWYDGEDQDCDGMSDDDADRDGHPGDTEGKGPDCDDEDASIYPGAPETWYDGVDSDCDEANDYDADRDGFEGTAAGGDDCDDTSDVIFPGASDVWYDGIDSDCDGANDFDMDGDGYESASAFEGGTDCNDADPEISPGATEIWYDGIDSDCDGANDFDMDGDGYESATSSEGGTDCDDADPSVYPGATEECDEVDSDCNGSLIDDLWEDVDGDRLPDCVDDEIPDIPLGATWQWRGASASYTGHAIDLVDHRLVIGAPSDVDAQSRVYVLDDLSPGVRNLESDAVIIRSRHADARLGSDVLGLEATDGPARLFIGMKNADAVASLTLPTSDVEISVGSSGDPAVLIGDDDGSACGYALAGGRLLSTTTDAVLIGCPLNVRGSVVVTQDAFATASGSDHLYDIGFRISTDIDDSDDVGWAVAAGDLNGDGFDDSIVGTRKADFSGRNSGAVHIYLGPIREDLRYSDSDGTIWGNETEDFLGGEMDASTDWDGDGTADLIALAGTGPESWDSDDGTAHFFSGYSLLSGDTLRADDDFATLYSADHESWEYATLLAPGDVDGDDQPDLMIGIPLDDMGGEESGAVYTVFGPIEIGSTDLEERARSIAGEPGSRLGWSMIAADLDEDGINEVLIGAADDDQVFGFFLGTWLE